MTAEEIMARMRQSVDGAFAAGAGFMASQLKSALGVQAPLIYTMPLRAARRAERGAIPRRVSGLLQSAVHWEPVSSGVVAFGIRKGPQYAKILEYYINHPFLGVTIQANLGALQGIVADRIQAG